MAENGEKNQLGYLKDIINNLYSPSDKRHKLKNSVEKDFKKCDKVLEELVEENINSLESLVSSFGKISQKVVDCQKRIKNVRENLNGCKTYLTCKRGELMNLWKESIEHKTLSSLLNQVDKVKEVTQQLPFLLKNKRYIEATSSVVSCIKIIDTDLKDVEALGETREELILRRSEIIKKLQSELHKQIYVKSTAFIVRNFQRLGSARGSTKSTNHIHCDVSLQSEIFLDNERHNEFIDANLNEIRNSKEISDILGYDIEDKPVQYIGVLIESLMIFNELKESLQLVRRNIEFGFLSIINRASRQVSDNALSQDEKLTNNSPLLRDLFDLILRQFRLVVRVHEVLLAHSHRAHWSRGNHPLDVYNITNVWEQAQKLVRQLFLEYISISSNKDELQIRKKDDPFQSYQVVAALFQKKRLQKNEPLFQFEGSSHAHSLRSYEREERQSIYANLGVEEENFEPITTQMTYVCPPDTENIIYIYTPVSDFSLEIELALNDTNSQLKQDITNFINNVYLLKVKGECLEKLQGVTNYGDWHTSQTLVYNRTDKTQLPIFTSAITVIDSIHKLKEISKLIPKHKGDFCMMLSDLVCVFYNKMNKVLQSITNRRQVSVSWVQDEDIERHLLSQHSWTVFESINVDKSVQKFSENAEKEADMFTNNLISQNLLTQDDLIYDDTRDALKALSCMIHTILYLLEHLSKCDIPIKAELAKLCNYCTLLIFVEIRVICFFYLQPLFGNMEKAGEKLQVAVKQFHQKVYNPPSDDLKVDENIIKLNKSLEAIADTLRYFLPVSHFRYVMSGIGHVIASIFINCASKLKRMNHNGVKKMIRNIFSSQQTVSSILGSTSYTGLDKARQYYELFYRKPEDLIIAIVERGVGTFTPFQLEAVVQLQHRTLRLSEDKLKESLQKLKEAYTY
ncbi:DgyrCDS11926 [Dimorphilus gyrociliatus]|uniref:Exocyst complex component Sec8 n=1 Tax=Dimorphilus gyrociliatus TaxID=2664684 RepID=A0A7I8W668_9ANNE|nr:DgyrCDS11926 [Dimorphilus gyrociliatus]